MTDPEVKPASGVVRLRKVRPEDIPEFFKHQSDPEASRMAAFMAKNWDDPEAHAAHWAKVLERPDIAKRTILVDDVVAGHVASFEMLGDLEVTYWVAREFWGRGVATRALGQFLDEMTARPLHARAAADNLGSLRVLEKCGFRRVGEERGFANARGAEIAEIVFVIDAKS